MARREMVPVVRFVLIEDGGATDAEAGDGGDGGAGNRFPLPLVPAYGGTEFTEGGDTFDLASSANIPGVAALNAAGYFLATVSMIADGVLDDFDLFISAIGGVPPVGVARGVSYLTVPGGIYTEGFAVELP